MATVTPTVWEMFIAEEVEYDPEGLIRVYGDILTLEEWDEWKHFYASHYQKDVDSDIWSDYLGW